MNSKKDFSHLIKVKVYFEDRKVAEKSFQSGPIILGRLPTSDLHLDYPFVSRQHCQIYEDSGNFYVANLDSRNGFFVRGEKVSKYLIADKFEFYLDKLRIGVSIEKKPVVLESRQERDSVNSAKKVEKAAIPSAVRISNYHELTNTGLSGSTLGDNDEKERTALIKGNYISELVNFHRGVLSTPNRKFEAVVTWKNQVFDVREFSSKEQVTIGQTEPASIQIPNVGKGWALAHVDFDKAYCYVPKDKRFTLLREGNTYNLNQLLNSQFVKPQGNGYVFKMGFQDVIRVEIAEELDLTLRYIPSPGELTKRKLTEPDQALKQAFLASLMVNGIIALLMIILAPETKNIPKLKDVPERYARLLVEPPKPIIPIPEPPPPPPEPPPEPPKVEKVVKKEVPKPEPKKIVKVEVPKPKVFKAPKPMEKLNKLPVRVEKPQPKTEIVAQAPIKETKSNVRPTPVEKPQPKLESLGALAALGGASNSSAPMPNVQNIQINKDAGGATAPVPSAQGVLNSIPSSSGKLMAAGGGRVATGGKGVGSGDAYGTQGLSGSSGKRGIAGAIVGAPQLVSSTKTEGLTRAQVMSVVQKHLAEVQGCYERSLLSNPSLAGRMEFEWDIQASGSVSEVRVKRSTVNNGDSLAECVKRVFKAMSFPKAKNGESTTPNIGFPFGRL